MRVSGFNEALAFAVEPDGRALAGNGVRQVIRHHLRLTVGEHTPALDSGLPMGNIMRNIAARMTDQEMQAAQRRRRLI